MNRISNAEPNRAHSPKNISTAECSKLDHPFAGRPTSDHLIRRGADGRLELLVRRRGQVVRIPVVVLENGVSL